VARGKTCFWHRSLDNIHLDIYIASLRKQPVLRVTTISSMFSRSLSNSTITQFLLAAANGDLNSIQRLVQQHGSTIVEVKNDDYDGINALHFASTAGHLEIVQYLIQHGRANVNATTNNGFNALHGASHSGHLEIVQYLTHYGRANVNATTNDGANA
jgi:ankyrin repeat protein